MLPHFFGISYFSCNMKKYLAIVRYKNMKIRGNFPNGTHNRNLKLCMYFKLGKKKKAKKRDAATSELFAPEEGKKR